MGSHKCNSCKIIKDLDNFPKNKSKPLGINSMCKPCTNLKIAAYRKLNPHKHRATSLRWQKENPEKRALQCKRYNTKNPLSRKVWKAKYRANILKRTPKWLTFEQHFEIFTCYRFCPPNNQVDHIIPLCGKLVSGLHVPWNLQHLTKEENFVKLNRFDGTYENEGWRVLLTQCVAA